VRWRRRKGAESLVERSDHKEVDPQLPLLAFLQRILNGGGGVKREYRMRRKRTNLLSILNYTSGVQRVALELKVGSGASATLVYASVTLIHMKGLSRQLVIQIIAVLMKEP
jgi:hypothetical protein